MPLSIKILSSKVGKMIAFEGLVNVGSVESHSVEPLILCLYLYIFKTNDQLPIGIADFWLLLGSFYSIVLLPTMPNFIFVKSL